SITSWENLTEKIFGKFYPPSRTNMEMKADEDEVSWDQTDNEMESNKEVTNNNEPCRVKGEDSKEENKIAGIFRIETDIFDYESPICKAFDEFNYLFKSIPMCLPNTFSDLKLMRITKMIGSTSGTASRHSEWPTCNWRDKEYCNRGNLPGKFQVGSTIHYQDYKWYEVLEDSHLKDEALSNKVAFEESMNHDKESSDDACSNYSPIGKWCDQGDGTNMEPDGNYNTCLDIARLFNNHTTKNKDKDV
ncbi:hypothetical protein Tco_0756610, partial [Tanacetum coccineum]